MPFSDSVLRAAWLRAELRCECTQAGHGHGVRRCAAALRWDDHGLGALWGWEAQRRKEDGADTLSNCQIVCQQCFRSVNSGSRGPTP